MSDDALVEALRSRDPGAPAALYAGYADGLYAYCWFLLRGREAAHVALRDTLIAAEAHIGRLRDPARLRSWLYALARLECARHEPADQPDVTLADPGRADSARRIMAWHAVAGLPRPSREILELRLRHGLPEAELGTVLGRPARDARALLAAARVELAAALTAELLTRQGPSGCAGRKEALDGHRGPLSPEVRARLLRHAGQCPICGTLRPQTVSAAKVYALLPRLWPDETVQWAVLAGITDPAHADHRLRVATRPRDFGPDGFPRQRSGAAPAGRSGTVRALVGAAAAVLLLGLTAGGVARLLDFDEREGAPIAAGNPPPRPSTLPQPEGFRALRGKGVVEGSPISATFPLGARASAAPPTALPSPPPRPEREHLSAPDLPEVGLSLVSPLFLDLGTGPAGSVTFAARNRPVEWRAGTKGPIRLDRYSGRLAPGESVTIRVWVDRAAQAKGEGCISFRPGGDTVTVTWRPGSSGAPQQPTPSGPAPTPTRPSGGGTPTRDTPSSPAGQRSDPPPSDPAPGPETPPPPSDQGASPSAG
ncbi:hypothetical protein DPM19_11785 [Actinomadura craniellae]|uniref:Sigma-70 family RNA polymerase sigma factor n=1 Tax=Actinomadura craniellae TaxID=2231787 RepID=A0A365HAS8_9ACTN|nr:sigma-70 family RNA polymerase sigma factor [Actinomadura craniellae]RAY15373.1 hypothetical protein DPM19_11785 [Actinomadura craniellae]